MPIVVLATVLAHNFYCHYKLIRLVGFFLGLCQYTNPLFYLQNGVLVFVHCLGDSQE